MADESIARSLENSQIEAIGKYVKSGKTDVFLLTKEGVANIAKKNGSIATDENLISHLLPDATGKVKCIVVDAGSSEIKFIDGQTLKVPELSTLSEEQKEILTFINHCCPVKIKRA